MTVNVKPKKLSGSTAAIPSKSVAHRALICAALSHSPCVIHCPATSKDIEATVRCLNGLGAEIEAFSGGYNVKPIKIVPKSAFIDCDESGSTLRFLLPVIAALGVDTTIQTHGRLGDRPLSPLDEELAHHGVLIERLEGGRLRVSGKLNPGEYSIAANISSQFISGLLFALPLVEGNSTLTLTGKVESVGYIKITEQVRSIFGITDEFSGSTYKIAGGTKYQSPSETAVEGDWSNAAFWLVAGAISNAPITCRGLSADSLQGDSAILDVLKTLGCRTEITGGDVTVYPAGKTTDYIEIDAANIPDLVPIISVALSVLCKKGVIKNAERLRIKESDRLATVHSVLSALGADIQTTADGLIINGAKPLYGGTTTDSFNDHRIAMSAAVAASVCEKSVQITGAEAVEKSYPHFWGDFAKLGGLVEEIV